jgi:hypothetical protein
MIKRDDLKLDGQVHIPEWGPIDDEWEERDREFAELLANKLAQGKILSGKFTNTEKIVAGLIYQHYRDRPKNPAQEAICGTAPRVTTSMNEATLPTVKIAPPSEEVLLPDAEWKNLSPDSQHKLQTWFRLATEHLQVILNMAELVTKWAEIAEHGEQTPMTDSFNFRCGMERCAAELEAVMASHTEEPRRCDICGGIPVWPSTGMCGPCTTGDGSTAGQTEVANGDSDPRSAPQTGVPPRPAPARSTALEASLDKPRGSEDHG